MRQIRIYLNDADDARMGELSRRLSSHASEASILSWIISAGLRAVEDAKYTVALPVRFRLDSNPPPIPPGETLIARRKGKRPRPQPLKRD